MMSKEVVTHILEDTEATRRYPFTRETLDKIADIRRAKEKEYNDGDAERAHMVPAPVVIAEAVDVLHEKYFP